jgi:L-aspartate oxidase
MKKNYNVIIVGTGVAGLTLAIKLTKKHPEVSILLISKSNMSDCNTYHAQGGVAAVLKNVKEDSIDSHVFDTIKAGKNKGNRSVVERIVNQGGEAIAFLKELDFEFTKTKNGKPHLALEGGHSHPRVYHSSAESGKVLHFALVRCVKEKKNITLIEKHDVCSVFKKLDTIYVNVVSLNSGESLCFTSDVLVLATGGVGSLFYKTTNSLVASGDGIFFGQELNLRMNGLSSIQMHPTALLQEGEGRSILLTEALRGAGAIVVNDHGERFLFYVDERGELATRDVVAAAIYHEIEVNKSNVFLDCTKINRYDLVSHFSSLYEQCFEIGYDLFKDLIPIIPAAHYLNGGIIVDEFGETSKKQVFAIGECANTGLHGENRLASNSLLEAIVCPDFSLQKIRDYCKIGGGSVSSSSFIKMNWKLNSLSKDLLVEEFIMKKVLYESFMSNYSVKQIENSIKFVKSLKKCNVKGEYFLFSFERKRKVSEIILSDLLEVRKNKRWLNE